MTPEIILEHLRLHVKQQLSHDATGHDWHHVRRVAAMARQIAEAEGADPFICEVAALVHDLIDDKLVANTEAALQNTMSLLRNLELSEAQCKHVFDIITTISFKGGAQPKVQTLEAMVVQDADRLDAIGAIGIARVFAYGGAKGRPMHNPDDTPRDSMSAEEYRSATSTAINHFYEKLLKLKSLMNTEAAKRAAEQRHAFLEAYLEQFYREWDGVLN